MQAKMTYTIEMIKKSIGDIKRNLKLHKDKFSLYIISWVIKSNKHIKSGLLANTFFQVLIAKFNQLTFI